MPFPIMILMEADSLGPDWASLSHAQSIHPLVGGAVVRRAELISNVTLSSCVPRSSQRRMAPGNGSFVTDFILVGLTDHPALQLPLFLLFLAMYMVTVLGNFGLITVIGLNSHLHTPMYFFLFNLSFIDLCYSSVFTPEMLTHFLSENKLISYLGCMTQLYFFCFFSISEAYALTLMA